MLSSRKVAFASMCLIGITLGGCQYLQKLKKGAGDADGGADADAQAETPATAVTEAPGATDDAGAAPLAPAAEPAATAAATATTKPAVATRADAGAAVRGDAGAASAADAGAPTAKTVVDAGAAPAPSQNCCCDVAGKKELVERNECTTTRKGQCVRMTSCATIIRR